MILQRINGFINKFVQPMYAIELRTREAYVRSFDLTVQIRVCVWM